MPLGSQPLGVGPLGFDTVTPASPTAPRQLEAPLIHPATHDALLLDDGTFAGVHPVDQAVCLALGIRSGTVGSSPGQGSRLWTLEYRSRDLPVRVRQVVTSDLALLISRGDIELLAVETTPIEGGFVVQISYRNKRLPPGTKPSDLSLRVA
jgi:hypothetical protein